MAGIVIGSVIALIGIVWSLIPPHSTGKHPELEDVATVMRFVLTLGYAALLVGCLLSLARHAAGSRTVRRTCWTMIVLTPLLYALAASTAAEYAASPDQRAALYLMIGLTAGVAMLPWLLCLYLFRGSRYP